MTTEREYQYDVAFSFLHEDEELAVKLNSILEDRLSTFLYSKRQEEIAGTDGEQRFNEVFGAQARVVVVLFRKGWGETPWTRIEETAIRNRAFEEGYDFVIFIPLDDPPTVPKYLPKNRIWIGLDRWGVEGAAAVIEARVGESGGSPKQRDVVDRASRLQREIEEKEERLRFLSSNAGVDAAKAEVNHLCDELERICDEITQASPDLKFRTDRDERGISIFSHGHSVTVSLSLQWANTMDQSALHVARWQGAVPLRGRVPFQEPKELHRDKFDFDVTPHGVRGWRLRARAGSRFTPSSELAQEVVEWLLDQVRAERIKRER